MSATSARSRRVGKLKYVEPYDFKHPKLFSKEIMRTLRTLHDVLARNLSRIFSSGLRHKVEVNLRGIDQISTSEFIHSLESPCVIYILSIESLGGEVIIVLPIDFCLHYIERQSGGRGDEIAEKRSLTTIEERIISRVMGEINNELVIAWDPYLEFGIDGIKYENKPENVHLNSVDPAIVAKLRIDLGIGEAAVRISYPYSLLKEALNESVLNKGKQMKADALSEEDLEGYKTTLKDAGITIQPLLGTTKLSIDQILDLKQGDTIPLDQRTDKPLEIQVNGVKKMTGYPGIVQGRRSVKIFELTEEVNEQVLL